MLVRKTLSILVCIILICSCNILLAWEGMQNGDFQILFPNRNTRLEIPTKITITWLNYSYSSRNIRDVAIEIIQEGENIYTITESTPNDGEHNTTMPESLDPGMYQIKIWDVQGTGGALSEMFEIIPPNPIRILQPGDQTTWHQGTSYTIEWDAPSPEEPVYISLLRITEDGTKTAYAKIADGIENNGTHLWQIPSSVEDGTYVIAIRVLSVADIKYSPVFYITQEK